MQVRNLWNCEELHCSQLPQQYSSCRACKETLVLLFCYVYALWKSLWPTVLPPIQTAVIPNCEIKCWHHPSFFHSPWKRGAQELKQWFLKPAAFRNTFFGHSWRPTKIILFCPSEADSNPIGIQKLAGALKCICYALHFFHVILHG